MPKPTPINLIWGIRAIHLKTVKNHYNNYQTWFLGFLLVLFVAKWAYFYLVASLVKLTIGLAISEGLLIAKKVELIMILKYFFFKVVFL